MNLVVVSTALPRRCGLAAFTDDLRAALQEATGWTISVCAIDRDGLEYGPEVCSVVRQHDAEDYRRAAVEIAGRRPDLVIIEHEFGIFGGADGEFVLELADELRTHGVRYAVTLHTILSRPSNHQRAVLRSLCAGAVMVTAFSAQGRRLAIATGIAPAARLVIIPHGAPAVLREPIRRDRVSPAVASLLGSLGRSRLVTTFGLVGPGKGLDHGIRAVAEVVQQHPDIHYLIAGATHPDVLRQHGETYRQRLRELARQLGAAHRVLMLDSYLSTDELAAVLARTDLFLTPYRSPEQICSGALTFALAAGKPVVSTAYRYAVDMLAAQGGSAPGVLVPCDDVDAMARAIAAIFSDPPRLADARESAARLGATLTWPRVAHRYVTEIKRAVAAATRPPARPRFTYVLELSHLRRLTNETGIAQFARGTLPDPESGYCVDDTARLAIVAARLHTPDGDNTRYTGWLDTCLNFLQSAVVPAGMHNLQDHRGGWLDGPHLGDHVGRAIWAAGTAAAATAVPMPMRMRAAQLLHSTAPLFDATASLRFCAYSLLGVTQWPDPELTRVLWTASARLVTSGQEDAIWQWFEPVLTYDNARLPEALLAAGTQLGNQAMIDRALAALRWYLRHVGLANADPMLRLVGNGWRANGRSTRAAGEGDEQPIDAAAVVEALVRAWAATGDRTYAALARRAFEWFHGLNRASVPLYDPATGGCRDGLSAAAASENQGAESTLAYYQALLALGSAGLVRIERGWREPLRGRDQLVASR